MMKLLQDLRNDDNWREAGSAMLITLLVMAVLTGLGAVVFNIGLNNLQNAGRDRLAGSAMGASEGGVAQAFTFIRSNGLSTLTCTVTSSGNPIGNTCDSLWGKNQPKIVSLGGGRQFSVWIQKIQSFSPPTTKSATYIVHSVGTAGTGPGSRSVDETIAVKPLSYPIGIYADQVYDAGGADVGREAIYSTGCINNRSHIVFDGNNDPYNGGPAAAHSTQFITDSNTTCSSTDSKNIHEPSSPPSSADFCNTSYPYDQDSQGGSLTGTTCSTVPSAIKSSFFDLAALQAIGYVNPRGLSDSEYAALKTKAQEQGQYYTSTSFTAPDPTVYPNVVMYFNLRGVGGTVNFQGADFNPNPSYGANTCGTRSIVIVVEGGDFKMNSNVDLVGAMFVPDGIITDVGGAKFIGTMFAHTIDKLSGSTVTSLESDPPSGCFFNNFPGSLLSVTPTHFREVDR
jgi:hypothetical protein